MTTSNTQPELFQEALDCLTEYWFGDLWDLLDCEPNAMPVGAAERTAQVELIDLCFGIVKHFQGKGLQGDQPDLRERIAAVLKQADDALAAAQAEPA